MTTKKTFEMVAGQIEDGFTFLNKKELDSYSALRSVAWNISVGFAIDNPRFESLY